MTCFTLGWTHLLLQELIEIPFLNWVAKPPELILEKKMASAESLGSLGMYIYHDI